MSGKSIFLCLLGTASSPSSPSLRSSPGSARSTASIEVRSAKRFLFHEGAAHFTKSPHMSRKSNTTPAGPRHSMPAESQGWFFFLRENRFSERAQLRQMVPASAQLVEMESLCRSILRGLRSMCGLMGICAEVSSSDFGRKTGFSRDVPKFHEMTSA